MHVRAINGENDYRGMQRRQVEGAKESQKSKNERFLQRIIF